MMESHATRGYLSAYINCILLIKTDGNSSEAIEEAKDEANWYADMIEKKMQYLLTVNLKMQ
jgi:hypothetical protein